MCIRDRFNTLYALSVAGMPIAVSRMVAQNMQQGRYRDVRKIKRLSTVSFLCTGLLGTLLMFAGAGPYVRFAENPNAFLAVFVMAPAIFFVCVSSSYRGYYEGSVSYTHLNQIVRDRCLIASVSFLMFQFIFCTCL